VQPRRHTEITRSRISGSPTLGSLDQTGPLPMQDLRSIQALPSAASVTADRVTIQPSSPNASASCGWPGCQRGEGFAPQLPIDHHTAAQPNVADAFLSNLGVKGRQLSHGTCDDQSSNYRLQP
jgi:hypothetical protein